MTNMQESTKKSRLLNLLKGIGVAVGILVVITVVIGVWSFAPGSTAKLEEIAGQFKAEPEWTLEADRITPPRKVCLDLTCDQLYKRWAVNENITTATFHEVIIATKWMNFNISNECLSSKNISAGSTQCKASGQIDGYIVTIEVISSSTKPDSSNILLRIRK